MRLVLLWAAAVCALDIAIHSKNLASGHKGALGTISYDPDTKVAEYVPQGTLEGESCIGTDSNDCLFVSDEIKQFVVQLDEDGSVAHLSTRDRKGPKVVVELVGAIPQPNLHPNNVKQKQQKQQKTAIGKEGEEEPEQTYIQKYWKYLIIPVFILALMPGDEKEAKE